MNNDGMKAQVMMIIANFIGKENVIAVPREFVRFTGDLNSAAMLSQIIYWSDRSTMEDGWFAKTYEDWEEEIGLSQYQASKVKNNLEKMGILETQLRKFGGAPIIHYRLCFEQFTEQFSQFLEIRLSKNQKWIIKKPDMDYQKTRNGLLKNPESSIAKITYKDYKEGHSEKTERPPAEPVPTITPDPIISDKKPFEEKKPESFNLWFNQKWDSLYPMHHNGERYIHEFAAEGKNLKRIAEQPKEEILRRIVQFFKITRQQDKYLADNQRILVFLKFYQHGLIRGSPSGSPGKMPVSYPVFAKEEWE